jgi:NodT family efflux transporter outer membrane factor (OMF) lipoprotein
MLCYFYSSLILFSALLTLSGCSVHTSKVAESAMEMPPAFSLGTKAPSAPAEDWWKKFQDPELNGLMEEAFRSNLDIAQAYERLQQSMTSVRIVNSSRGINLNIEGSGGRARRPGINGASTDDTYSLSAAASYEIDLWGKLKSRTEAARYDALASEQDLTALYISISAQLADLYYLAVEQRDQLSLTDQTIASFQDTLERVERRYRAGLVPAIDFYQSQQNLSSAKAQRPVFESRLAVTLNAISILVGRFPDRTIGGTEKDLSSGPDFHAGLPSQLLANRPDIRSAYLRIKASDERIAAAIADRFPSFNLVGSYGGSSNEVSSILDSPNIFWNILLQAAQPVLDGERRKAEVDRTESVFRENLASYHKTVLNAFKDVEDALVKIRTSKERIRMLNKTVSASDSSLRLALDRYMQGLTDYLPVLTEQVRNATAKSNLIAARRQLISERIQLARAIGGNWADEAVDQYMTVKNKEVEHK